MAALWEQKADVRTSIREQVNAKVGAMTREELESFATGLGAYARLQMTLSELKAWDANLKKKAEG